MSKYEIALCPVGCLRAIEVIGVFLTREAAVEAANERNKERKENRKLLPGCEWVIGVAGKTQRARNCIDRME